MCDYELPNWFKFIVSAIAFCYPLFEFWIGRTPKLKAASGLELILNLFKSYKEQPQLLLTGRKSMLEGKEVEGKIGEVGSYSLDVDDKLTLKASVVFEVDLFGELDKLAVKSKNKIFIGAMEIVSKFLGRDSKAVAAAAVEEKPVV